MHMPYLPRHFLCKLSALCTFCLHCVDFQAFTQCIQPRFLSTLLPALPALLPTLSALLSALPALYLHICLHCLHTCLHCVDFQVVASVYNPFFVCTTIYTAYVLHNHTRVSVVRAVPVSFNDIGRARNFSEQLVIRPPYARQARLLCHKKNTAACNACRRQCIQNSDLSTLCKALKISAVHAKSVECRQNSKKIFQTMRKGTVVLKSLHSRGGGYPLITATGSKRVLTFTRSASL